MKETRVNKFFKLLCNESCNEVRQCKQDIYRYFRLCLKSIIPSMKVDNLKLNKDIVLAKSIL